MTILTIGSVNIDHAYRVAAHPAPGETILDRGYLRGLGGKGANMSMAAHAAGGRVAHAGAVGPDGAWCREAMAGRGIDVTDLVVVDASTGHAVIMVDDAGENIIVVHSGANHALTIDLVARAIARRNPGDWLLLQNETNLVPEAAAAGRAAGLRVAYAAAPFDAEAVEHVLPHTDLLALNAVEAEQLATHLGQPAEALGLPSLLVTHGADGATFWAAAGASTAEKTAAKTIHVPAFAVDPVDTTGAGDTFLGAFLAGLDQGRDTETALRRAAAAAALQVTRPGAADAIPSASEIDAFLDDHP